MGICCHNIGRKFIDVWCRHIMTLVKPMEHLDECVVMSVYVWKWLWVRVGGIAASEQPGSWRGLGVD